jgi:hypothetical protein
VSSGEVAIVCDSRKLEGVIGACVDEFGLFEEDAEVGFEVDRRGVVISDVTMRSLRAERRCTLDKSWEL